MKTLTIINVIGSRKKEKLICMKWWEILVEKQITTKDQMKKLKIRQNIRIKNSFNGLKSRLDAEEKLIYEYCSMFIIYVQDNLNRHFTN